DLDNRGPWAKSQRPHGPAAMGPLGEVQLGGDVIAAGLPAVRLDELLLCAVDCAHLGSGRRMPALSGEGLARGQRLLDIDTNHAVALPETDMSRRLWAWARLIGCVLTFAVLVWRLGTGPFLHGLRTTDGGALAAAAGLAVLTTVSYAWRWKLVARGLGVDISLPAS